MIFSLLIIFLFLAALLVVTALFLFIAFSLFILSDFAGAPFVPSDSRKIQTMMELAGIKPGETIVDLGSGNGSLLIEAARRGAQAIGVEINPFLVWYTRLRLRHLPEKKRILLIRRDFKHYPLHNADVVFLYLWPNTNEKLRFKLEHELKSRARIVSNSFPLKGWAPSQQKDGVFLYQVVRKQT